jgi:Cd2+/Zn2+-exporting ATPase/Cu+-exporting ATPase
MSETKRLELPIAGMDCAECTTHVKNALAALPGIQVVEVFLASERASLRYDPAQVDLAAMRRAVAAAGYTIPKRAADLPAGRGELAAFNRRVLTLLGVVFGAVLFIVVAGEWFGLLERLTERVPWPVGLAIVLVAGYPVFTNVIRAVLRRQIISHTLMTLGVIAALAVGQWATAAVVVFFMRVGDYAERFTTERARRAVRDLSALAPRVARVARDGAERELPLAEVRPGDIVIVRPGESIPVDGEVVTGHATVDQSAITGEALPREAGPGTHVYAATLAQGGHLRVRTTHVGPNTTFGRVITMVEEAEARRADVQRIADRFSAYYLPIVAAIAALTFLLRRDPLATAAVLVVACSCSIALATPIAMLASIGAGARRGLLIKGGRYLELLARADVLLIDKTGTLTLGRPQVTDVVPLAAPGVDASRLSEGELLRLAASAERYSEHPLAEAVRRAAAGRGLSLAEPADFAALPGLGVRARVDGAEIVVGNRRMMGQVEAVPQADELAAQGKTLLWIARDGALIGLIAVADTLREEVPAALTALRELGVRRIELLTGDNAQAAAALAGQLGVAYRAGLLPEDKIRIVREYQAQGHRVVMVGDGVNDAPALAQAEVGIAMGAGGTAVAVEAAHIALLREDWRLVPQAFRIARRTMRSVKMNLAFTAAYNVVGLTLAALGILPPILAAAAQSLPDLGILGNSSRLLRQE